MSGKLYLVGVGPGDPELLTLKAARILSEADIVVFPQKAGQASMSYEIAKSHINPRAQLQPVDIPMAIERAPAQKAYDAIAALISNLINQGKTVAYLCEGDPLFYGSAMYVLDRMDMTADIEIVPGVTSLTATAAAIARPLAARNDILKILPAPLDDNVLRKELNSTNAVAIIKLGRHFDRIKALLEATDHAKSAILVEHASGAQQRTTPLFAVRADHRPYFATILCYNGQEAWAT